MAESTLHIAPATIRHRPWHAHPATLWVGRLAVPLVLVAAWAIAAGLSSLVPPVGSSFQTLAEGFTEGWIIAPLESTMISVIVGFLIASAVGFPLGFAIGRSRYLSQVLDPLIAGAFAIPRIIVYPILLGFLGVGVESKVAMAVVSGFFPIILTTVAAIREVKPVLVKMGKSMNCRWYHLAFKIFVPAAAPSLMVGLRIGFSISFISVIIAEFFAADLGLGLLVSQAYGQLQLPRMFAVIVVIVVIALIGNLLLWGLERRVRSGSA